MTDTLIRGTICTALTGRAADLKLHVYDTVGSTNTMLKEMAVQGAPEGTVVAAASQTAGRGRMGRQFWSPQGTGLYMSILFRPQAPAETVRRLTPSAAVAVCRALASFGTVPSIKWVNDVYVGGKKVCGILTEGGFSGNGYWAVVGIGINVCTPEEEFPDEIRERAGSAFPVKRENLREQIAAAVLNELLALYPCTDFAETAEAYRKYSFVPGKRIRVAENPTDPELRRERPALALDVDEECRLLVRYDDGTEAALDSGEISIGLI